MQIIFPKDFLNLWPAKILLYYSSARDFFYEKKVDHQRWLLFSIIHIAHLLRNTHYSWFLSGKLSRDEKNKREFYQWNEDTDGDHHFYLCLVACYILLWSLLGKKTKLLHSIILMIVIFNGPKNCLNCFFSIHPFPAVKKNQLGSRILW